jgi:hypothetical protein
MMAVITQAVVLYIVLARRHGGCGESREAGRGLRETLHPWGVWLLKRLQGPAVHGSRHANGLGRITH